MRALIGITISAVAAMLIYAAPGHLGSLRNSEPEEISRLNESIQKRFLDRTSFGMSRILPNQYHGIRTFQPENPTESAIVNELQQKGYELALYLAGRNILVTPTPAQPPLGQRRYAVQGPAYITHLQNTAELPAADVLLEDSRAALSSFAKGDGYDIQKGAWTVAFRPLRASNAGCVQCHSVKIGDALGLVLYVYR